MGAEFLVADHVSEEINGMVDDVSDVERDPCVHRNGYNVRNSQWCLQYEEQKYDAQ